MPKREKATPSGEFSDIDTAWQSYKDACISQSSADWVESLESAVAKETPKSSRVTPLIRVAFIAAVLAALFLASTVTAYALGYDLWGHVAAWTRETFGFIGEGDPNAMDRYDKVQERTADEIPEQLRDLYLLMVEKGFDPDMIPRYIPAGYTVDESEYQKSAGLETIYCLLVNGDSSITISYDLPRDGAVPSFYEKDVVEPEIYESNGNIHYILLNNNQYYAVWMVGNMECSIYGFTSRDELIKMVDSIYGG